MPRTKDYNLREATEDDAIDIAILGKQFVKESQNTALGWNSNKVHDSILDAIDRQDFGVFVLCSNNEIVGMLICFVTPCFFSDVLQAVEIAWYVTPEHRKSSKGIEMIKQYEEWARSKGAAQLTLMNLEVLEGDRVAKVYHRLGYTLTENTFSKEL